MCLLWPLPCSIWQYIQMSFLSKRPTYDVLLPSLSLKMCLMSLCLCVCVCERWQSTFERQRYPWYCWPQTNQFIDTETQTIAGHWRQLSSRSLILWSTKQMRSLSEKECGHMHPHITVALRITGRIEHVFWGAFRLELSTDYLRSYQSGRLLMPFQIGVFFTERN